MLKLIHYWYSNTRSDQLLVQSCLTASSIAVLIAHWEHSSWAVVAMAVLLCLSGGQTIWLISQMRSACHRAEAKLREAEQRFYHVFEQAPFVIQLYAPDGSLQRTNRAWETVWNHSRTVLTGYNIFADKQIAACGHLPYLQRAFAGEAVTLPALFYKPTINGHSGRSRWIETDAYSIKNDVGKVQEIILITKDITDRKQAEAKIAHSFSALQATLEATADGIVVFDQALKITHFNQRFLNLWQLSEEVVMDSDRKLVALMQEQLVQAEAFISQIQAEYSNAALIDRSIWALKNGRILERYSQPQWLKDKAIGRVVSYRDITEEQQAKIALHESEDRFRAFMNHNPAVAFMKDAAGRNVYVNSKFEQTFQVKSADIQGKLDREWLPEEAAKQLRENDAIVLATEQVLEVIEIIPTLEGLSYWLVFKFPFQDAAGNRYVGGVAIDITQQKQMEEALFREKELAQVTLHSIGDGVITTDAAGHIQYFNPVAEKLIGWSQSEVQGLPLVDVFRIFHETTRERVENPVERALRENQIVGLANHTILLARDDREIPIEDSAAPIHNRQGQTIGAVMVFHDVTQNRTLSRQLSWQATHDALTGLVNRREFERQVQQALSHAKSTAQIDALCYLDLDRFKIVNDTCGHLAGDELLRQITTLLQTKIRKTDTLARLGGDEFGVLLRQCSLEQALRVANKLRESVQAFRFVWQEQVFSIGVSIGLVNIDIDSENLAEVLSAADAACYSAKNRGRNRVYVVETDDEELLQQRGEVQWVSRIAHALENDCFCLYAQPIAAITSTAQTGDHYEVLLRLQDEQGGIVPPMDFIPAAERYNLMHLIDRWVIQTLFKNWSTIAIDKSSIYAINLSGSSINDDQFIHFLHEQFAISAVPPERICFEITETVAIANLTKASQFILELQRLGCRFALDDFGAGMSSFAYLKSLPIDYLKIDGGFIRNIVENSVDEAIVAAITHIGVVMGIRTIAEFVENDQILQRITDLGIDYAQGYGIAKPRPLIAAE